MPWLGAPSLTCRVRPFAQPPDFSHRFYLVVDDRVASYLGVVIGLLDGKFAYWMTRGCWHWTTVRDCWPFCGAADGVLDMLADGSFISEKRLYVRLFYLSNCLPHGTDGSRQLHLALCCVRGAAQRLLPQHRPV